MAKEIVYWRGGAEPIIELINALTERHFSVRVFGTIEEVVDRLPEVVPSLVIVDATLGDAETSNRIIQLTGFERLYEVPFLFMGPQAENRTEILIKQFEFFFPVDTPLLLGSVVDYIGLVCSSTDLSGLREKMREELRSKKRAERVQAEAGPMAAPSRVSLLSSGSTLEDFDDQQLLPPHHHREELEKHLDEMTEVDEQMGLHARRVATGSSAIARGLSLEEGRDANLRVTGLMFDWGLQDQPGLASKDVLQLSSRGELEAIAEGFRGSAQAIIEQLDDELASRTVNTAASLLLGQRIDEESRVVQDAQCALAVELADRACWIVGNWDHRGAHRMIRALRSGSKLPIGRAIAEATIQIIGDAANARQTVGSSFSPPSTQRGLNTLEVARAFQDAERSFSEEKIVPVGFPKLKAGMILGRPLVALDGRLILPAQTCLSDDLILRLIQLSAIRPLQVPIVVAESM